MIDITTMERRDQLAYLALYYAIHGEDERALKIRFTLNELNAKVRGKNTTNK